MHRDEQAAKLRGERERLLGGILPGETGSAFRQEIVSSWRRCELIGVRPTGEEVPYQAEFERSNRLLRAAGPVISWLAEQLEDGPISILLADSDAQIIERRVGRRELANALDRALVSPGFLYAEEFTGTNGIGTALETAAPFIVSGAEHFRENLQEFTCAGSPLRHPVSGKVEGVLDVTCQVKDKHGAIKPLVLTAVREIESRMLADASRREQLLLQRFLRANRRASSAVISLNEDVIIANTAASGLLNLSDQAVLWEWACRMLGTGDEYTGEVRLAGDAVAQARATRVNDDGPTAGVLIEMRPRPCGDGRAAAARRSPDRRSAVQRSLGSDIGRQHLPPGYRAGSGAGGPSLRRAERDAILEALAETRGNKLAAAERLGVARSTLYRKMRTLGIDEKHLPPAGTPR